MTSAAIRPFIGPNLTQILILSNTIPRNRWKVFNNQATLFLDKLEACRFKGCMVNHCLGKLSKGRTVQGPACSY